jgi:hypothetical protein
MNTRTLILIVVLGVITIGLVTLAIKSQSPKEPAVTVQPQESTITEKPVNQTSLLYFEKTNDTQPTIGTSSAQPYPPLRLMLNSGENNVMGAQIELSYDPKVLTNVRIVSPTIPDESFFGASANFVVLDNSVKQNEGRISYVIAMSPNSEPKVGVGSLATLTFNKIGTAPTTITFLEKSNVQQLDTVASVLKEAQAITIE